MSQQVEGAVRTFLAGETLAAFRRVKINTTANTVVYADAGDLGIGITQEAASSGAPVSVRLNSAEGTHKMMAAGALSINDIVFSAASGKIDDAPTGVVVGRAFEAATADGDLIEVEFNPSASVGEGDIVEVIGGAGGIAANDLVYVSDETDGVLTVLKAQGTNTGRLAEYICPNAIAAGEKGIALKRRLIGSINTSSSSAAGAEVYLSDAAAGGYTFTKPTATDKVQVVGVVVEDATSTGAILFDLSGPVQIVHTHADASEGGATIGTAGTGKGAITLSATGIKVGGAADEKVGFYGATPVVQPAHNADITALTENSTSIGGSQNDNFATLSLAWDATSSVFPTTAEATLLIDAIRECAAKVNACVAALAALNAKDATIGLTATS